MKTRQNSNRVPPTRKPSFLGDYEKGRITEAGLMVGLLRLTDQRIIVETLKILPPHILKKLKSFLGYYTPSTLIFNGPRPNEETVEFVRHWFANRKRRNQPLKSKKRKDSPSSDTQLDVITLADIRAVKDLADKLGTYKLQQLAEVLGE
jgi:hypothetical protein